MDAKRDFLSEQSNDDEWLCKWCHCPHLEENMSTKHSVCKWCLPEWLAHSAKNGGREIWDFFGTKIYSDAMEMMVNTGISRI